jgi:ornithine cyclodeaminase/alanine dehydrogenase-like protein (mu-crystallin family)
LKSSEEGLLIYKAVGCGVMDVSLAEIFVALANEMNIGVGVDGF